MNQDIEFQYFRSSKLRDRLVNTILSKRDSRKSEMEQKQTLHQQKKIMANLRLEREISAEEQVFEV